MNRLLTDTEWKMALEYPRKASRNPKFNVLQLMIMHQAYLTPHRLNTMFPEVSDECPRCHAPQAKLLHMLWSCHRIQHYWSEIYNILHGIAPLVGDDLPEHCILGVGTSGTKKGPICKFLNLALILAKRNITMKWKASTAPSLMSWYNEMVRWGRAEGTALKKEETKGLRKKKTISLEWNSLLEELLAMDTSSLR